LKGKFILIFYRVLTGHENSGKCWDLNVHFPGMESHGILCQIMWSRGNCQWRHKNKCLILFSPYQCGLGFQICVIFVPLCICCIST
jgi:hypothetical protein